MKHLNSPQEEQGELVRGKSQQGRVKKEKKRKLYLKFICMKCVIEVNALQCTLEFKEH